MAHPAHWITSMVPGYRIELVNRFLVDFTRWAAGRRDIAAVALVGSHARGRATADSDVDLVILTSRADFYLRRREWAETFGVVAKQEVEDYGRLTSLRVHYADGLEVEYGLTDEHWAAEPLDEGTRAVIADGMKVLLERESQLSRHAPDYEDRRWTTDLRSR